MNEQEIIDATLERADERYVHKDTCNTQMGEVKSQVGGLDGDVKVIKNTVMITNKVLWAIFVAALGCLIATVWDKLF